MMKRLVTCLLLATLAGCLTPAYADNPLILVTQYTTVENPQGLDTFQTLAGDCDSLLGDLYAALFRFGFYQVRDGDLLSFKIFIAPNYWEPYDEPDTPDVNESRFDPYVCTSFRGASSLEVRRDTHGRVRVRERFR